VKKARLARRTARHFSHLGEAVLAQRNYQLRFVFKDYDTAVRYYEQARELLP